jgi:DNA repair exonuclease SbcCD ATPase subunit
MSDLADIADELYTVPPEDFVALRDERAKQARADGDRALATAVARLPRPTIAAWLLNQLVRSEPEEVAQLVALGDALREAQRSLSGPQLRQLSRQRHDVIDGFARRALAPAEEAGRSVTADLSSQVRETLGAAIADPEAGEALLSGRLTKGLAYVGLGDLDEGGAGPRSAGRAAAAPASGTKAKAKAGEAGPSKEAERAARERAEHQARLAEARTEAERLAAAAQEAAEALEAVEHEARGSAEAVDASGERVAALEEELQEARDELERACEESAQVQQRRDDARAEAERSGEELDRAREQVAELERAAPG